MRNTEKLEHEALSLDSKSRARLAHRLLESLDEDPEEGRLEVDQDEIENLWIAEAEERDRRIDAGRVALLPAGKVLSELRDRRG